MEGLKKYDRGGRRDKGKKRKGTREKKNGKITGKEGGKGKGDRKKTE